MVYKVSKSSFSVLFSFFVIINRILAVCGGNKLKKKKIKL